MRSRWVLRPTVALVCCALLSTYCGLQAQAADPPKTIIDIGTSPLCTTLRESVVPVLVGLHANDALISFGHQQLGQWSYDAWREGARGGFWRMDRLRVENAVSSLVRNLNVLDGILNDPKRFPHDKLSSPTTTALHDQLQAVEDGQRKTLNDLYGPVDNSMMSDMMQLPDQTIQPKAFSPVPAEINSVGRSVGHFVTLGGTSNATMDDPVLSNNSPTQAPPPSAVLPEPSPGSFAAQQLQIAQSEADATQVIQHAVDECKKAVAPTPKN